MRENTSANGEKWTERRRYAVPKTKTQHMHLILISLGLTLLAVAQPNLRDAKVAAEQQLQWDQVPLNQFPFLMSHDSATGRDTRTNKFRLTPFPYASSYHHAAVLWCHCTAYGRQVLLMKGRSFVSAGTLHLLITHKKNTFLSNGLFFIQKRRLS